MSKDDLENYGKKLAFDSIQGFVIKQNVELKSVIQMLKYLLIAGQSKINPEMGIHSYEVSEILENFRKRPLSKRAARQLKRLVEECQKEGLLD